MEFVGGGGGIFHGDGMLPEDAANFIGLAGQVQLSPLVRVVSIGQQAEADDIRVELIALEIREAGAVLYWRAFTTDDRMLGLAVVEVADDHGREYDAYLGGGSGGERAWSGETNIAPSPATGVSTLRVTVTGFDSFASGFPGAGQGRTNGGPWAFEVPLTG